MVTDVYGDGRIIWTSYFHQKTNFKKINYETGTGRLISSYNYVTTVEAAHDLLDVLPLGVEGLMTFDLIPVGPLSPLRFDAGDNWYAILLEGSIDDTHVQFIDQVHVNEDGLIDHVDIFLRPASMAQILLAKVTAPTM